MAVIIDGDNTPTAGGIVYGDGTAYASTAAGSAGQVLQSNGSGAPSWVAAPATSPAGSTGQVQYNNAGAFGAISSGTSGQVLTSAGAGVAPNWATPSTTATNLAGGGAGQIPYQSASNSTLMLAAGSAGQVLQSNGLAAPSWITPSSGALTLISTTTANNSSSIDITSGFTSTYDMYMIVITNMNTDSSANFWAQMYINGSLQTGNVYEYNFGVMDTGGYVTNGYTSTSGDTRMYVLATSYASNITAPKTINATLYIPNPSSTSVYKYMYGSGSVGTSTYRSYNFFTTAGYVGTSAMTGIRFYMQTGTMPTGKFRLYGIANS